MAHKGRKEAASQEATVLKLGVDNKRQTFLFSATLSFEAATQRRHKGKHAKSAVLDKMETLLSKVQFQNKVKRVDLSTGGVVASGVDELKVQCVQQDKDILLCYLLLVLRGRALVFFNSVANVRRMNGLMGVLGFAATSLHASMQQRQRLGHLDRFKAHDDAVLLATDVAARGLDIPNVDLVIHYDLPPTSESYVHRCGRTARAGRTGKSVALVGPNDMTAYRKICFNLNKEGDGIANLDINATYIHQIRKRVTLAKQIEERLHRLRKTKSDMGWLQRMAEEMDIDLDETTLGEEEALNAERKRLKQDKQLGEMQAELKELMRQPIAPKGSSRQFIATGHAPGSQLLEHRRAPAVPSNPPGQGNSKKNKRKNKGKKSTQPAGAAKGNAK